MSDEQIKVELYVYDLSKGLAAQYSPSLLGFQINGVWHTSVVFNGLEYFYGAGVQISKPGMSHHGEPLEKIYMGETSVPMEIITEYIDSLRDIYVAEKYDLFAHNCNNFTQDLCEFLVGKDIPKHISSLPSEVLKTPFGAMMKPLIEQSLNPITTRSDPYNGNTHLTNNNTNSNNQPITNNNNNNIASHVRIITRLEDLEKVLNTNKATVVFFTSASCPPCISFYPKYDQLSMEYNNQISFIKVDVSKAREIGMKYSISATPTFITFHNGEIIDTLKGAALGSLISNLKVLIYVAFPPHKNKKLNLPFIFKTSTAFIIYNNIPPLDKLELKLNTDGIKDNAIEILKKFIHDRQSNPACEVPITHLQTIATFICKVFDKKSDIPEDASFPIVDLLRIACLDTRFSFWFAEEKKSLLAILQKSLVDSEKNFKFSIVTLKLFCNLFNAQAFIDNIDDVYESGLVKLLADNLKSTRENVRLSAASFGFNIAVYIQKKRNEASSVEVLKYISGEIIEPILKAIEQESESEKVLTKLLETLSYLVYCAPSDEKVIKKCEDCNAIKIIGEKKNLEISNKGLCDDLNTIFKSNSGTKTKINQK